ncbi:MAG: hypothetical protein BJ554DRAFT_2582 [Olpidium bornovanus]|uniref:Uncharacterized protein n=1 Tax=Olpidium bornovanus TaxID=278681 RepID=A0A8H7ZQT0_9FUNG|nr:MAG: hypothetical protein BJ554DRAFT_2582 [Olpidium bornovanus]
MTRPKTRSDWLIMPASRARLFSAPDRPIFSDPARSTKLSFPMDLIWVENSEQDDAQRTAKLNRDAVTHSKSSLSGVVSFMWTVIEKIV